MRGFVRNRGSERCPSWTAYWSVTDADGKRRQRTKGGFRRKKDAQAHLTTVLSEIGDGSYSEVQDKKITVAKFLTDHWLPSVRTGATKQGTPRRNSTVSQYETVCAKWIVPYVGGVRLIALTPKQVESWLTQLAETGGKAGQGLSGRSCQLSHTILRMGLDYAVRTGYLNRNPVAQIDRPGAAREEMQYWTAEQRDAFLAATRGDRLCAAWSLFLQLPLRRGEVAGMRWGDLDLDAGQWKVLHTRISVGGRAEASTPKTKAGRRVLPLVPELVTVLREHRRAQLAERMAAGPAWRGDGTYVFVNGHGEPLHPEMFTARFERLCGKVGVPLIRLHDCRHSVMSIGYAAGVSPVVMKALAGHSTTSIGLDVYGHSSPAQHAAGAVVLSACSGSPAPMR